MTNTERQRRIREALANGDAARRHYERIAAEVNELVTHLQATCPHEHTAFDVHQQGTGRACLDCFADLE